MALAQTTVATEMLVTVTMASVIAVVKARTAALACDATVTAITDAAAAPTFRTASVAAATVETKDGNFTPAATAATVT